MRRPPSTDAPATPAHAPRGCLPSDRIEQTQSVVRAMEFGTARYVELAIGRGALGPSLVLKRTAAADPVSLGRCDVTALAELQNALAYLVDGVTSVRVRTTEQREADVRSYLATLAEGVRTSVARAGSSGERCESDGDLRTFTYDGETFELAVESEQ